MLVVVPDKAGPPPLLPANGVAVVVAVVEVAAPVGGTGGAGGALGEPPGGAGRAKAAAACLYFSSVLSGEDMFWLMTIAIPFWQ